MSLPPRSGQYLGMQSGQYLGVQSGCTWECSYARPGRGLRDSRWPGDARSTAGCGACAGAIGSSPAGIRGASPARIWASLAGIRGIAGRPRGLVGRNPWRQLTCFPTRRGRRPVVPQSVQPGIAFRPVDVVLAFAGAYLTHIHGAERRGLGRTPVWRRPGGSPVARWRPGAARSDFERLELRH
jgi:hypothetical protein